MIKLVDVYTEIAETRVATKFLYELLKERDATKVNISHREMPSFEAHMAFVDSKPYREWFVIFEEWGNVEMGPIGAIYLSKDNEIGIFISKAYQGKGYGKKAVRLLMQINPGKRFLANIAPGNVRSLAMFEKMGFELKQLSICEGDDVSKEDTQQTIGKLHQESYERDAIHIAVIPVMASETLKPGQHIGFTEGGYQVTATPLEPYKLIGIVDPFFAD